MAELFTDSQLRGFAGYASDAPWPPTAVEERLLPGDPAAPPVLVEKVAPPSPAAESFEAKGRDGSVVLRRPALDAGPIRGEWIANDVLPYPETSPVAAGGLQLVAVVNEHRLEARRGGRVAWAYIAGGRISRPPAMHDGRAFVASHDGVVACLDLADGRLLWRFRAAPNDRRIVAYGQLESAWPAYGAAIHDGLVCTSAGRHPELDGGIWLYGLDPATGRPKWAGRLHKDIETLVAGAAGKDRRWTSPANTLTNGRLESRDGKLLLISADATNEGVSRPLRLYELPIDPANPPR